LKRDPHAADKESELFWSIGVLEKAKARISDRTNAYHYSITPADFRVKERP
jgi:hypothetical protein